MPKRKEDWIYIIKPDDERRIASPGFIKELLGIEEVSSHVFTSMYKRIQNLEKIVDVLEKPFRQHRIMQLLEDDGGFHTEGWIARRIERYKLMDLRELEENKILSIKMSGYHKLYGILKR